jgi:hypothetical protein
MGADFFFFFVTEAAAAEARRRSGVLPVRKLGVGLRLVPCVSSWAAAVRDGEGKLGMGCEDRGGCQGVTCTLVAATA